MCKPTKFQIGIGLTTLWIIAGIIFVWVSGVPYPDKLDGWANVLAGFFSPVAFLWLVLGYMQQGEELTLNTEAIRLQADELKLAVEQYQDMARTQREQFEFEKEKLRREELEKESARMPRLSLVLSAWRDYGAQCELECTLENHGGEAMNITIAPEVLGISTTPGTILRMAKGDKQQVRFQLGGKWSFPLRITYLKQDDSVGEHRFQLLSDLYARQDQPAFDSLPGTI